jgi:hypothetical protein
MFAVLLRKEFKTLSDQRCKAVVIHSPGIASLDEIPITQIESEDILIKVFI